MQALGSMGVLFALGVSVACTTIPAPPLQAPYFSGDVNDNKALAGSDT